MIRTIIFDLSEVLIAGLLGVEHILSPRLSLPPETILAALGGGSLRELCRGLITEEEYLAGVQGKILFVRTRSGQERPGHVYDGFTTD
jgi:hypothetical protein